MSNMTILVILYYFQGLENSLESKEETSYFNRMYVCIISGEKNVSRARELCAWWRACKQRTRKEVLARTKLHARKSIKALLSST